MSLDQPLVDVATSPGKSKGAPSDQLESLDIWPIQNKYTRMQQPTYPKRWPHALLIGILAAVITGVMQQSAVGLHRLRRNILDDIVYDGGEKVQQSPSHGVTVPEPLLGMQPGQCRIPGFNKTTPCNCSLESTPTASITIPAVELEAPSSETLVLGWLFWAGSGMGCALLASAFFASARGPPAIPDFTEVMKMLNRFQVSQSLKQAVLKGVAAVFATASGLPVGKEETAVFLCTVLAHHVVGAFERRELSSPSARFMYAGWNTVPTQSHRGKDRHVLTLCGMAAGVASILRTPIGACIFTLEAVGWGAPPGKLVVLAAMTSYVAVTFLNSSLSGWEPTHTDVGELTFSAQIYLHPKLVGQEAPMHLLGLIPAAVVGILCGLLTHPFYWLCSYFLRARLNRRRVGLMILEVAGLAVIFCSLAFSLPLLASCQKMVRIDDKDTTSFIRYLCHHHDRYSSFATLMMNAGEDAISHLFIKGTKGQFNLGSLLVFLLVYIPFTACMVGTLVTNGFILPALVIGGTVGRVVGEASMILPTQLGEMAWLDPGALALVGAGAFFAGTFRFVPSFIVILVEMTGAVRQVPTMVVAMVLSCMVSPHKSEMDGVYHLWLSSLDVPILTEEAPPVKGLAMRDICHSPLVTLKPNDTIGRVVEVLTTTSHSAFGVVDGTLFGTVLRGQLEVIVEATVGKVPLASLPPDRKLRLEEGVTPDYNPTEGVVPTFVQARDRLTSEMLNETVDLTDFMHTEPFTMRDDADAEQSYYLFVKMAMRRAVVLDPQSVPVGMVTRRDFTRHMKWKKSGASHELPPSGWGPYREPATPEFRTSTSPRAVAQPPKATAAEGTAVHEMLKIPSDIPPTLPPTAMGVAPPLHSPTAPPPTRLAPLGSPPPPPQQQGRPQRRGGELLAENKLLQQQLEAAYHQLGELSRKPSRTGPPPDI